MVLDEKITTTISYLSIEYYKSIGYVDIKCNQKIEIPISDLPIESNLKINVKCDVFKHINSFIIKYTQIISKISILHFLNIIYIYIL